jgi:DNA polymerase-3 subunit gamma/tau
LLEHFRNLAVLKVSDGRLLPEIPEEEAAALRKQTERIGTADCDRAFRVLRETDEEVGRSAFPKLVLEMALIKLATQPVMMPLDDLVTRMEELEVRLRRSPGAVGSTQATAPPPRQTVREVAPPPKRAAAKPETKKAADGVTSKRTTTSVAPVAASVGGWPDFVDFVRNERPTLAEHLRTCEMSRMDGNILEVQAPAGFRHDYLARRDHVAEVEDLVARFFQRPLRFVVQPGTAKKNAAETQGNTAATKADLTTAAMGDPVVRAAVEILGGEVAEVRSRRSRRREEE